MPLIYHRIILKKFGEIYFLRWIHFFIKSDGDVRKILGEIIASRQVEWVDENPSPKAYKYNFEFDPVVYYETYIIEKLELVN